MGWGWDWYPKPKPRRPANGIKAQSGRQFGKTWWASKWLDALERLVDPGRLTRGRSYARSGQVLNLDIKPGRVDSRVQGSRPSPYQVQVEIRAVSDKDWERVADAMAEQAIFAAKLLSGEMPPNIEEAFATAKVNLFPVSHGDLETECSCPDYSNPCKHIAAVYYLLGEQFDADPFLLFRLRGKSKDEIMAMLRARRTAAEPAPEPVEEKKRKPRVLAEPVTPLEKCLDRFWDAAENLDDFAVKIEPPTVDAIPIKRLGTPGFWRDHKVDFIALFARAYKGLTEASLNTVLGSQDKKVRE
ncbi:MAG: SWIM zinc finger family protein [Anaerolineales bacterium]|nr:SWIM zinc finger family protein [Anaerolineales bacterium]